MYTSGEGSNYAEAKKTKKINIMAKTGSGLPSQAVLQMPKGKAAVKKQVAKKVGGKTSKASGKKMKYC